MANLQEQILDDFCKRLAAVNGISTDLAEKLREALSSDPLPTEGQLVNIIQASDTEVISC